MHRTFRGTNDGTGTCPRFSHDVDGPEDYADSRARSQNVEEICRQQGSNSITEKGGPSSRQFGSRSREGSGLSGAHIDSGLDGRERSSRSEEDHLCRVHDHEEPDRAQIDCGATAMDRGYTTSGSRLEAKEGCRHKGCDSELLLRQLDQQCYELLESNAGLCLRVQQLGLEYSGLRRDFASAGRNIVGAQSTVGRSCTGYGMIEDD